MEKKYFVDIPGEELLYQRYRLLFGEVILNLILYGGIWIFLAVVESFVSALVFVAFAFAVNIFIITPAYKQVDMKSLKFENKFLTAFLLCWIVVAIIGLIATDFVNALDVSKSVHISLILLVVFIPSLVRDVYRIAKLKNAHLQQMREEGLCE